MRKKCNNDIASTTFKFIVKSEYKLLKIISLARERRRNERKNTVCIRDLESLTWPWCFRFRLKSISLNDRATPITVVHVKSGQK